MSFLFDFNLINDGKFQRKYIKNKNGHFRTNMTFLPVLSKRKIVREFLIQFFTAKKIYTFFFTKANVLMVKIILEMNFQRTNKYVDIVGSEKLYQELSDYLSFTQDR